MDTGFETRIDFSALNEKIGLLREQMAGDYRAAASGRFVTDGLAGRRPCFDRRSTRVAKTLMAKVLSHLIEAGFCRIQFTPDLMPSDVLGTSVFYLLQENSSSGRGPVFPIFYWWMRSTARRQRRRLPF